VEFRDLLLQLKRLANDNGLSEPFIVGGLPRDKILNKSSDIQDVDLTTGDESIHKLALVVANYFKVVPVQFPDGHYQMYLDNIKFDFSSNYQSPNAAYFLEKVGLNDPTQMQLELFSRDFTCNILLFPMDLRKILDPTGLSLNDIRDKVLKTPLPPRITLRDDPNRVVRAIYLAAKLGFTVEEDIIKWVLNHHEKISAEVSNGFARKKLAAATRSNPNITIQLMNKMQLWNVVSLPKILMEQLITHEK
jgi:tRNA nucleotidyltransferase (CCA-adding enzyme)